eukprot:scaffold36328_cov141-Skeletonema_marinoi.AAC.2
MPKDVVRWHVVKQLLGRAQDQRDEPIMVGELHTSQAGRSPQQCVEPCFHRPTSRAGSVTKLDK